MALVDNPRPRTQRMLRRSTLNSGGPAGRRGRGRWIVAGVLALAVAVVAGGAIALVSAHAALKPGSPELADIGLPLGGGKITSVTVTTGPHSRRIPVSLRGNQIWPGKRLRAHEKLAIDVTVRRPGWMAWLTGHTETLHLTLFTPSSKLRFHYLTLRNGEPVRVRFTQPVAAIAYGSPGHLHRQVLPSPQTTVVLPRRETAGTMLVAATPRTWEYGPPTSVSWFPAGAAASAVTTPRPGTTIGPGTPITLTFNKPVARALGADRPPVSPASAGQWQTLNSHAIIFRPSGYGFGMGAKVTIALPRDVLVVGGQQSSGTSTASWTVPGGTTLRLQQLLTLLNYLPLRFQYAHGGVPLDPAAQEQAAVKPPAGNFTWRYPNTPPALKSMWSPGADGVITKGALMAFENDHGLTADGVAGPAVWRALVSAVLAGKPSSFGYTWVDVSTGSQSISVWHSGKTVVSGAVNTGIASRPTATGTYPVFEHLAVTTMSGTNPDGSHYNDPGIPWVSYFNGGDALHGFTRAQYGFPQSLGCVEMPFDEAGRVYPYTPIGTIVHVV